MNTVVVFTSKSVETIFADGGSGFWKINKSTIAKCSYIVMVANANSKFKEQEKEKHGHAFMIGKVSGHFEDADYPGRLVIKFSEYAFIDIANKWSGQRNPVRYADITEFGLDLKNLAWESYSDEKKAEIDTTKPLTIEEAKMGLAKKLGIDPGCIEISIKA